jgi:CheY-like chemotaxis protein
MFFRINTETLNECLFIDLAMPFVSTILCVDDDEDDLLFLREAIAAQDHSFHIEEASNGIGALEYLEKAALKGELPCLVIMDINMPRMNGRETIRKIKANPQFDKLPVVVFTTSSQEADKDYFENLGIHFFSKPFDFRLFKSRIADLLAYCADLSD